MASFDEAVGLGEVADGDGESTFLFHCTQIADGSRTISPGTKVAFRTVPGHHGCWEAVELRPDPSGGPDLSGGPDPSV